MILVNEMTNADQNRTTVGFIRQDDKTEGKKNEGKKNEGKIKEIQKHMRQSYLHLIEYGNCCGNKKRK